MSSDAGVAFALVVSLGSFLLLIKLFVDYRIKRKLIENNLVRKEVEFPNISSYEFDVLSWLKWGIVLIALGISIIIPSFFPFEISDEFKIGLMCSFTGIAFIISYLITKKQNKKDR
jgi:hypothetical protein